MARRPTVEKELAEAIDRLDSLLRTHHTDVSPRIAAAIAETIDALAESPLPVCVEIAREIGRIDELLQRSFAYNFQYHITADGKTIAAANTPKCANAPGTRIHPKIRRR